MANIRSAKSILRQNLKKLLKDLPSESKKLQSEVVVNKLLHSDVYKNSQRISVYLSRDIEVDTTKIIENIFTSGKECFIPKYDSKSTAMEMVKLKSMKDYKALPSTAWNIKQPADDDCDRVNALTSGGLDLIIVPGIGFTKDGRRIGNGKGYYDIYINKCRAKFQHKCVTIALAFTEQIVESIPTDAHDADIDEVVSP